MRLVIITVVSTVLVLPAGAVSKRKQCRQACGALITTCTQRTAAAGFGNLAKGCKQAVTKRCLGEGPAVCGTFCGNGTVDGAEACDGGDLGGATCAGVGFASGGLACTAGCGLDTSGCVPFPPPGACGNGAIDAPEQCDGAALGGATCRSLGFTLGGTLACTAGCGFDTSGCASQGFPESGQTVVYGADKNDGIAGEVAVPDDGTVQAGQSLAYVDHGDGTITDMATGLMWEKKSDDGGLHDADNSYGWSGNGSQETIWDWLEDVNAEGGTGFAGHTDWRIPNVKELQSLVSYGRVNPAVEPAFHTACTGGCTVLSCSCTRSTVYWSSSTVAGDPTLAWYLDFFDGFVGAGGKTDTFAVRGVRGGS
jgi:hypothetical protein